MKFGLEDLEQIIKERSASGDPSSWTSKLVGMGIEGASKKLGEEATETIIAACSEDKNRTRDEAADLLYHLLVVLHIKGVAVEDVIEELHRRTKMSGVQEKEARKANEKSE